MSKAEVVIVVLFVMAMVGGALYVGRLDGRLAAIEHDKDFASFKRDREAALALIEKATDAALSKIRQGGAGETQELSQLEQRLERVEASAEKQPDDQQLKQLSQLDERLKHVEVFLTKKRDHLADPLMAPDPAPWGTWRGAAFCPENHYVCGIEQKVEPQQGNGDDTAVNGVRVYCCPL
jgi:hypothetical protein